ncbi:MAG: flagellar biosynthetic protein FliR [Sphingomonadales bacterium CG12_big_fil_rev_8_21_14_0_65_65_10]|uniref:Flagellar biosynthetic protein FliR n=1 Tax=Blastomonas marina TaxID=1867408 RepID=A0ABQ1F1D5_9SPHN|nr:flagellar biosynthetic protein FliR [Blastomonas marina]PIW54025.1 MAG: flagellar biosynthetic protein FliR [Sphingomonadales bacterium CG12_big_fil_rev_8_21_14_0_65_65_10]WPZ03616.1 flagellar biosynthetic protein FliR [Blastomonas marina]GFZ96340.1 flagellar biosynthetic protein FliR [Blastomonas marina]
MIAPGLAGAEDQLWQYAMAMIRPGAALMVAPIFGASQVPLPLRIILALMIAVAATGLGGVTMPPETMVSFSGLLFVLGEVLVGAAMGFALQIGFSAAFIAGETLSNAMGLGFASLNDPQSGTSTPVLGQFLSIAATLLLLAMDGHLMLIAIIVDSYSTLPPGNAFMSFASIESLVQFGGSLFGMGLLIALPVGSALILIQVVMAMLARSAPAMNLFAVGLPVALLAGLVLLAIATPIMAETIMQAMGDGLMQSRTMAGG